MESIIYHTITGRTLDITNLNLQERSFITTVLSHYREKPEWTAFSLKWSTLLNETGLNEDSITYKICQDLEARIGIEQGVVSPPDYRDYLADLIEATYGSFYRFCKETETDPGHLSRVLAGQSDFSLKSLYHFLNIFEAVMVIKPEKELRAYINSEEATNVLSTLSY